MVAAPVLAAVAALFVFTPFANTQQYITLTGRKSIAKWGTNRGTFQKLRENMPYLLGFSVLSRLLGVQKVTSSNLVGPTTFPQYFKVPPCAIVSLGRGKELVRQGGG